MSTQQLQDQLNTLQSEVDGLKRISDLPNRVTADGTEKIAVDVLGTEYKMDASVFFGDGGKTVDGDYTVTDKDRNKRLYIKGASRTLTIPNDLGWANLDKIEVMFENAGFTIDDTAITDHYPQALQDVAKSLITISKIDRVSDTDVYVFTQEGVAGAGGGSGTAHEQVAYSTSLVFDAHKNSTYGDTTDNSHTQTGTITFTYDFTGAVEGAVRTVEIVSNGNNITVPNALNNTRTITNNSKTTLSVTDATITPENGERYFLVFWYTNGNVNVFINDADLVTGDFYPPTYITAPVAGLVIDEEADCYAELSENGTIYGVIVADGATAPTPNEVKNGTGSGGSGQIDSDSIAETGDGGTLNFVGLTPSTAYDIYVVGEDAAGNLMAAVTKVDVTTTAAITLPDFTGNSVTRIYSLFRSEQSTKKYPVMITDGSGNDYHLFFDSAGKISMDSKIGLNGSPLDHDLTYYKDNILVGTTVYIKYIYCQITSHSFSTAGLNAKIWDSTNGLSVKAAETSIRFLGTNPLTGAALTELDDGNDFSMVAIASNEVANSQHILFANNTVATADYFSISNDRRTQKRIGILRDTALTFFFADDSAQDDTNNVKRQTVTVDISANMVSYKDAVSKTTVSVAAQVGYNNDDAYLGGFSSGNKLDGHFQGLIVCNAALSSTQVTNINTEIDVML